MDKTTRCLMEYGIRPSPQRVAVMNYLLSHLTHPTVDKVYEALHPQMPTLSKTTVYNTLKLFEEKGAIRVLNIDEKNLHLDADTTPHAHFLCQRCGRIFDIAIGSEVEKYMVKLAENQNGNAFVIMNAQINFKGLCPDCQQEKR